MYGMKYSWKGQKDRNRHKDGIERSGQARLVYVFEINRNIPTTWSEPAGTAIGNDEDGNEVDEEDVRVDVDYNGDQYVTFRFFVLRALYSAVPISLAGCVGRVL